MLARIAKALEAFVGDCVVIDPRHGEILIRRPIGTGPWGSSVLRRESGSENLRVSVSALPQYSPQSSVGPMSRATEMPIGAQHNCGAVLLEHSTDAPATRPVTKAKIEQAQLLAAYCL